MLLEIPVPHLRSRKCRDNIEWCVLQDVITRISRLLERAEVAEEAAVAGHKDQPYQKMRIMFLNTFQLLIALTWLALVQSRAIPILIWRKHQWLVAGLESPGSRMAAAAAVV